MEVEKPVSVYDLTKIDFALRNESWEENFLKSLPDARLRVLGDAPQQGPDGWPYLLVETHPQGETSALQVLSWLTQKGIGLVVNPNQHAPDFVLTYGMIWNFTKNNRFLSDIKAELGTTIEYKEGSNIHAGAPAKEYLPDEVREILKNFFKNNNVPQMKVLVLSSDRVNYDLCFSLECLGQPPESEHQGILEAISWFLPPHYTLALISEKNLPPFVEL